MNAYVEATNANDVLFKSDNIIIDIPREDIEFRGSYFVRGESGVIRFYNGTGTPKPSFSIGDYCKVLGMCAHDSYFQSDKSSKETYDLLSTLDGILFSAEFMKRFSLVGTSNYKCSKDGISVDCYTAIPMSYGYDSVKNSLMNYLKAKGVDFRVLVRRCKHGTFMFNLKVCSVKAMDEDLPEELQALYGMAGLLRFGNFVYSFDDAAFDAIKKRFGSKFTMWDSSDFLRSNDPGSNYRLIPIDGKVYYLQQAKSSYFNVVNPLLNNLYDTYSEILKLTLLDEVKIGGTNHGFSTIPYVDMKKGLATVDVPIRASLLPYSQEEIKDAIAEELMDHENLEDVSISDIDWNFVRFKVS